ncbi:MAG: hypothetical protein JXB35_14080, partial [Anaerolineae bacterium]|nr:hypothetical protein [Anaerolineae bacterium]
VTIITCSHVTTGRTDCRQQDTWAGWMPLDAPTTIRNLTEAEPDRRRSSNPYPNEFSSYTFHLKLKDEEGAITASECFTYPQAKRLAETLNTFLADPEADSVTVHTLHWASAVLGFISTIVPNFVLGGLLLHRWPRHTA